MYRKMCSTDLTSRAVKPFECAEELKEKMERLEYVNAELSRHEEIDEPVPITETADIKTPQAADKATLMPKFRKPAISLRQQCGWLNNYNSSIPI